jgi:hypothetical protein
VKAKIEGIEYNLVGGANYPKRGKGDVVLTLEGNSAPFRTTSNRGFSAPEKSLDYIWFLVAGKPYYLALDYTVAAATLSGKSVEILDGKSSRADPIRVPARPENEAGRIEKFRATVGFKKIDVAELVAPV